MISLALFVLALVFGALTLTYLGISLYRRQKDAAWEAACERMEAAPVTESEAAIGEEWQEVALDDGAGDLCSPTKQPGVIQLSDDLLNAGVKLSSDSKGLEEVFPLQSVATFVDGPPPGLPRKRDGGGRWLIDYDRIPSKVQFFDEDGGKYYFESNPDFCPTLKGSSPRRKIRVLSQTKDPDYMKLLVPSPVEGAGAVKALAIRATAKMEPLPTAEEADFIPSLVRHILGNEGALFDYYDGLDTKTLAFHIREANSVGRERVARIKKKLDLAEKEILTKAKAHIEALKRQPYEESPSATKTKSKKTKRARRK